MGDRVRIWLLAAGPNVGSAFHVVGDQFDTVYREGVFDLTPGTSHVMSDAERGATGNLQAEAIP